MEARQLLPSTRFVYRARLLRKEALIVDAQNRITEALRILADAEALLAIADKRNDAWWREWIDVQLAIDLIRRTFCVFAVRTGR